MIKKCITIIFTLLVVFLLAGCNGSDTGSGAGGGAGAEAKDTLTENAANTLAGIIVDVQADLPMMFEDAITAETAQGMLGLTPEQFEKYVSEAAASTAAISTFAIQISLVKCNDFTAATEVKSLIAKGYDSGKWICVFPEQSMTVESGSYVLLAVGPADTVDAILKSFTDAAAGNVGSPDVFFTA